jgi:hypothetical protein
LGQSARNVAKNGDKIKVQTAPISFNWCNTDTYFRPEQKRLAERPRYFALKSTAMMDTKIIQSIPDNLIPNVLGILTLPL